jgi:Rrf2 family protein
MKITMETDYAIRILYCLAKHGEKVDAKTISEEMGVTLRFSLKILRKLVMHDIVRSYKGVNGGYELNRPPSQITFADIVSAVDGEIGIHRCLMDEKPCTRVGDKQNCMFRKEFQRINQKLVDEFQSITLERFL